MSNPLAKPILTSNMQRYNLNQLLQIKTRCAVLGPYLKANITEKSSYRKKLQLLTLKINNWGGTMMVAHEVLSGMKKGSRGHCLRVSETQGAGGRCYGEGRGWLLTQCRLQLHSSLQEDAEVYLVQKAISQIQRKKNPFGSIKNEGVISGQEVFGPQTVAVCEHFWKAPAHSACRTCHHQRQGNKPGSPVACLFLIFMYHSNPVPSTFEEKPQRL